MPTVIFKITFICDKNNLKRGKESERHKKRKREKEERDNVCEWDRKTFIRTENKLGTENTLILPFPHSQHLSSRFTQFLAFIWL